MTQQDRQTAPDKCPLCSSTDLVLHRWYSVKELRAEWIKGFGFDPFDPALEIDELRQYLCLCCDLRFYAPALCGDESFYENLSGRFPWYYEKDKWEFDEAVRFIGQTSGVDSILEIGCGHGHFLRRLQPRYQVRGLEFNPKAVAACQALQLDVRREDIANVTGEFDVVAAFEVLEHVPMPGEFLAQAVRLLRTGGYLIIAVPDPDSYLAESERVLLDMPPHHVLSFSKKTLAAVANQFGLQQVAVSQEPLRFVHYRSFLSDFISAEEPATRFMRLVKRFTGLELGRTVRLAERRLREAIVASSFANARDKFEGQTHLVVYRKE
jgi:SAM-dependent methyltransferase